MTDRDQTSNQLTDWIVGLMSAQSEPSPTRDYYFVLLRRGYGVPEAVGLAVDDLLEEIRSAVSRKESYNPRAHRARLGLQSSVPFSEHRLPRPALVRRIVQERMGHLPRPQPRGNTPPPPRGNPPRREG
jgi:hypothetical protein